MLLQIPDVLTAEYWLQSMIRDDGERTLLLDLDTAIQRLTVDLPNHPAAVQLTAVYHTCFAAGPTSESGSGRQASGTGL